MPEVPVGIVGGNKFGLYKKISDERSVNFFVSDGWGVSFAGHKRVINFPSSGEGRALFHSVRGNILIAVVSSDVYVIDGSLNAVRVGAISGTAGEVYIDENLSDQVCIVDGVDAYIYNYSTGEFAAQNINATYSFNPQYVSYHNSFFLLTPNLSAANSQQWYVFIKSPASTSKIVEKSTGSAFSIQTKPDYAVAVHRLPGKSNNVIAFGRSVCEFWTQVGGEQNYRRNSSFNIDSGVVSRESIASSEEFVCWLSQNEDSQRAIMMTDGASVKTISNDGIDKLLQDIVYPQRSTGFFFRQEGHLFYQLTFYGEVNPFTLVYDFDNNIFYYRTNANKGYHPARQMAYFFGKLFFISIDNGGVYETSPKYVSAIDSVEPGAIGEIITPYRVTNTLRSPNGSPFRIKEFNFSIEQGFNKYYETKPHVYGQVIDEDGTPIVSEGGSLVLSEDGYVVSPTDTPRVDLAISKNGAATFSPWVSHELNAQGVYQNKFSWHRLGRANEITFMLRFTGLQRWLITSGVMEVY